MPLISLISGQLMPNLFSVILLKPEEVILVHTIDSKDEALFYSEFIKKQKYGVTRTKLVEVRPFNPAEIRKSAAELLEGILREGNDPDAYTLNYTGGTKPMSIEFVTVFKEAGAKLLYIDTQQETCWWTVAGKIEEKPLQVNLNVPEIFSLGRGAILDQEDEPIIETLTELTNYLYQKRTNNGFWRSTLGKWIADSVKLQQEITGRNKSEKLTGWKQKYSDSRLSVSFDSAKTSNLNVRFDGVQLPYKKKEFWLTYFTGGWFEHYVFNILKSTGAYDDIRCNIRIITNDENNPQMKNEMDVVAVKNGIPVFVECKTGVINQKSITNLKTASESYGGKYGEAVLVALETHIASAILEKIQEYGIQLIKGAEQLEHELKHLHEYMVIKK